MPLLVLCGNADVDIENKNNDIKNEALKTK